MLDSKSLEIITLSENTATGCGILAEWGLSILIRIDDRYILMDAGAGVSAAHNADILNIDLKKVDTIVLSHGHNDHTGGLRSLLTKINRKDIRIIAHPGIWDRKFGKDKKKNLYRYGGIPHSRDELESLGACFHLTREPIWITENIVTSGEEPMISDFEVLDDNMYIKDGEHLRPDPMADDQSVYIKTDLGLIVILGCAHRGIINIIYHGKKLTDMDQIYMVVGGTHLVSASQEKIQKTIAALKDENIKKLGVSHCTGQEAMFYLAKAFKKCFFYNQAGTRINFPYLK